MLRLRWKNKRYAKSRILQHGEWWTVIRFDGSTALIKSVKTGDLRWVDLKNDKNFEVFEGSSTESLHGIDI